MKILFVVAYAPNQIRPRAMNLIKALASMDHKIKLATLWTDGNELKSIQPLAPELEGLITERIHITRSLWNCIRALPGSQPLQAHYSWSPQLAKKIAEIVQENHLDAVHIEHLRGARYALLLNDTIRLQRPNNPPVIWDSVDCISDLYRYASQNSYALRWRLITKMELPRTEKYEGWLVNQFDRVLVTSESDRRGLLNLEERYLKRRGSAAPASSKDRIAVVPNGVDLDYFSPSEEVREPQTIVFTGKMSYHANITAVGCFVQNVMPKIWAELPKAKLWVVGKNPPSEIRKLGVCFPNDSSKPPVSPVGGDSRIQITGTVEDIRPFLRKATLAVAPIRYAVGIQNKVLEAMACGTPVVTTPKAIRAIDAKHERDLVVAEGNQQLADSIIFMLKNASLCTSIGHSGRSFVERNHNWHSVARNLIQIYRDARH